MPRARHLGSSVGFTLVEVLVAIVLVSLLLAGAAGLLTRASRAIQASRVQTTAVLLASQKIEEVRAAAIVPVGTRQERLGLDGTPLDLEALEAGRARFVRRWTVSPDWEATRLQWVHVEVFVVGQAAPVATADAAVPGPVGGGA